MSATVSLTMTRGPMTILCQLALAASILTNQILICTMDVFELTETELRSATGLSRDVFIHIYTTYCGAHTIINTPKKLYELYVYFKTYPVQRTFFLSFEKHKHHRYIQRLQDRARYLASGIFI